MKSKPVFLSGPSSAPNLHSFLQVFLFLNIARWSRNMRWILHFVFDLIVKIVLPMFHSSGCVMIIRQKSCHFDLLLWIGRKQCYRDSSIRYIWNLNCNRDDCSHQCNHWHHHQVVVTSWIWIWIKDQNLENLFKSRNICRMVGSLNSQ